MGRQILSQEGHDVVTVSNGDEALQYLEENRPDLVMADTRMPGPSGYDICREVKHSGRFPGVGVVLLAGPLEPFDSELAESSGSDAVLHKPLDAYSLIETINKLIDGSAQETSEPPEPEVMQDSGDDAPEGSEAAPAETAQAEPAQTESAQPEGPQAEQPPADDASLEKLISGDPFEDLVEQALAGADTTASRETKVRAAVAEVLEASLPALVDTITKRVLAKLNGAG